MPYLNFDYYKDNGGIVDNATFSTLYKKAKYKLDNITLNRIKKLEVIPEEVKDVMVEFINKLSTMNGDKVSSFSNDGVSVSLVVDDDNDELYQIAVEILPINLVSAVANYENK